MNLLEKSTKLHGVTGYVFTGIGFPGLMTIVENTIKQDIPFSSKCAVFAMFLFVVLFWTFYVSKNRFGRTLLYVIYLLTYLFSLYTQLHIVTYFVSLMLLGYLYGFTGGKLKGGK